MSWKFKHDSLNGLKSNITEHSVTVLWKGRLITDTLLHTSLTAAQGSCARQCTTAKGHIGHHLSAAVHSLLLKAAATQARHSPGQQYNHFGNVKLLLLFTFRVNNCIDATHSAYPVCQGSLLSLFNVSTGRDACSVEYCRSSAVRSKKSGRP